MLTEVMSDLHDYPCVILAGGKGTRLVEETATIPKPMLDVGGKPLLAHVMDTYIQQGVWSFIIPVGYKQEVVRAYFLSQNPLYFVNDHRGATEFQFGDYKVTVVFTGYETQTGGRLRYISEWLAGYKKFFFTYGDGVANVNLNELIRSQSPKSIATLTAVHPMGRFGKLTFDRVHGPKYSLEVTHFGEKQDGEYDWINGGFSILSTKILRGIKDDTCNLEKDIYPVVAHYGFMNAYQHNGYWKCVDTLRDLEELRSVYYECQQKQENAPWLKL